MLKDDTLRGFQGSLPFAHAAIHAKTNTQVWSPIPEYDFASLLFTICALKKGVAVPWHGFTKRLSNGEDDALKDRRNQTKGVLVGMWDQIDEARETFALVMFDRKGVRRLRKEHVKGLVEGILDKA